LNQLLVRGFYALKDTKTPLFLGASAILIDIVLSLVFTRYWQFGIAGLTAAASISSIVQAGLLLIWLGRRVGGFSYDKLFGPSLKVVLAGFCMAVFLWLPMRFLDRFIFDTTRVLPLLGLTIIASTVGLTVYLLLTWALKIEERESLVDFFTKVGNWRRVLAESKEPISECK
jgi:putative peptidoglycan lipid II flippase